MYIWHIIQTLFRMTFTKPTNTRLPYMLWMKSVLELNNSCILKKSLFAGTYRPTLSLRCRCCLLSSKKTDRTTITAATSFEVPRGSQALIRLNLPKERNKLESFEKHGAHSLINSLIRFRDQQEREESRSWTHIPG